jgi:hypothetical protein
MRITNSLTSSYMFSLVYPKGMIFSAMHISMRALMKYEYMTFSSRNIQLYYIMYASYFTFLCVFVMVSIKIAFLIVVKFCITVICSR